MFSAAWKLALLPALALAPAGLQQQTTTPPTPAPAATSTPAPAPVPASTASPVKVENQDSFTVVGVTVRTNNAAEASGQGKIPDLWQNAIMNGTLEQIPNKVGDGMVVVYSDYASDNSGDFNYTLGVRVTSADKIPDGMVKRTVVAGKYATVQSAQGVPQEVIPALWQRIAQMTPQEMGGARAYQTDFEIYAPITDPGSMQTTAHIGLK
jgi:predicted transcriptional regulator YdeE